MAEGPVPIRIAWIFPTLDYGGAERQYLELARAMDKRRFDPLFILTTATASLTSNTAGSKEFQSISLAAASPWIRGG